ncbi:MAG: SDR family oxidoreductase [Planctomycetes bacterium]|nr:SDR family oxidoreductase [Planctomycetota bacterium]
MARVLVAGGAGFIGSHLCERLLRDGHAVWCVDNGSTGDWANVAHLRALPRFEAVVHDVVQPLDLACDWIVNLACPASPEKYQSDPVGTITTSVVGALNLLGLARATGARLLQASTSEVYGDPAVHPQPESYWGNVNPIGPRSCYDEGKRCAEALCFSHHRQFGVDIRVVRLFNTYGPRMQPDDGRVVSNFVVQALLGRDLAIYGDGNQTRSFCYIDDLVEALVRALALPPPCTGPMNLGNPSECTVLDLAQTVIRLVGSRSRVAPGPALADDPRRRRPDIALAERLIDWHPEITLAAGLERTIAHFRGVLGSRCVRTGG